MTRIVPVILCGGSGTRLWPLSSQGAPKQMLPLIAPQSMLELTINRVADRELFQAPLIVASQQLASSIAAQPWGREAKILAEPVARNTAPAVALATLSCDPEDLLLVLPSDHAVENMDAFHAGVRLGRIWAEQNWFVTFGMKPSRAETGYGYIRRGEPLAPGICRADSFVEKPDRPTAERFLADGGYDWNAGIFLFKARDMAAALAAMVPDVDAACRSALLQQSQDGRICIPHGSSFARSPAISLDYAVMEKADRIAVLPVDLGWSDLGSWDALFDAAGKDSSSNVLTGRVIARDVNGCLIRSDGPPIAALGLQDLVVVAAQGAILVIPRGQSQRVKELVEAMETANLAAAAAAAAGDKGANCDAVA